MPKWGFLTNHALVLIHVYEHPQSTLREIADAVGITERAALSILRQMEEEECVRRKKVGRRVHYTVNLRAIMNMQTRLPYRLDQIVRTIARLFREAEDDDGAPVGS
jgi:DNA-binding MarR family transcriptional regulator